MRPVHVLLALGTSALGGSALAQPSPSPAPPTEPTPAQGDPAVPSGDVPVAPIAVTAPSATPGTPPVVVVAPTAPPSVPPSLPPGPPTSLNEAAIPHGDGFRFGSYGRITVGTDLRGGKPENINIVEAGPRTIEDDYLELDFQYGFESKSGVKIRPVVTLAFDGTLFHDTGNFDATPALRNLYVEAEVNRNLTLWIGSRMYRGDDIYLFDYWPLDNLNTVGGGVMWHQPLGPHTASIGDGIDLAIHWGANRLDQPYQFESIEVTNPEQGETTVEQLNRERFITSATASYTHAARPEGISTRFKIHGQYHKIDDGTFKRDDGTFQDLPADSGFLIGAELSFWGLAPLDSGYRRHLNLFARYSSGLAAFDPLSTPSSFDSGGKTTNANEISLGAAGNWDYAYGNVLFGVLSRRFIDANDDGGSDGNFDDGWEYAVDARPLFKIAPDVYAGADISYQARFPRAINPFTERAEDPGIFAVAPMVVYSPMGPSAYDRPQLRAIFNYQHLNQGAVDQYVPDDPRHGHDQVYFLGLQAEWWFNSTTYKH